MISDYLTKRNKYAQLLMDQEKAAPPIQSHMQGLASLLRHGMAGYMGGQDLRDRQEARSALVQGLTAKPWVNPDTGQAQGSAGGVEGAASALSALGGNEYAQQFAPELAVKAYEREQALADELRKNEAAKGLYLFQQRNKAPDKHPEIISALEAAGIPREKWAGIVMGKYGPPPVDYNKPFLPGGIPNAAYQNWALREKQAGGDGKPTLKLSEGEKAVDKKFADEYVDFKASGGFADIEKNLQQLREVSGDLGEKELTGPLTGRVPDFMQSFTNPDALDAKNKVEEVVQRNLRLILGAQFTEKEGERLIARAYNPALSEEKNKERVDRLIKQIEDAAKAKREAVDYFDKHGTLKGFNGRVYGKADFAGDTDKAQDADTGWKDL